MPHTRYNNRFNNGEDDTTSGNMLGGVLQTHAYQRRCKLQHAFRRGQTIGWYNSLTALLHTTQKKRIDSSPPAVLQFVMYYIPAFYLHLQLEGGWPRRKRSVVTFNMPPSYQYWVWEREANINWSMVTCQGSTRSELP